MSNLEVCGFRVLVEPKHFEEVTEGGIILNVGEDWKREKAATVIGTIVNVGPTAWKGFDDGVPWAKVGDKVYYAKYAGKTIVDGDKEYVILNDEDIQCIINEETE
uniref:Co-chaperonin GroES n=1 Tax=uncultured virus TaxID=340016 RepID=A0A221S427_9VIRU|nr:co-chaperonin GroES [uncultured virus]